MFFGDFWVTRLSFAFWSNFIIFVYGCFRCFSRGFYRAFWLLLSSNIKSEIFPVFNISAIYRLFFLSFCNVPGHFIWKEPPGVALFRRRNLEQLSVPNFMNLQSHNRYNVWIECEVIDGLAGFDDVIGISGRIDLFNTP